MRGIKEHFEIMFKIEPCRNQQVDINHKRLREEKEDEEKNKKKKKKRNLQLPQEIENDAEHNREKTELELKEEEQKQKLKEEDEEKEKSVQDYLKLGHEKLLLTCMGVGYTNMNKTFVLLLQKN